MPAKKKPALRDAGPLVRVVVDPGKACGVAIYFGDRLLCAFELTVPDTSAAVRAVVDALQAARVHDRIPYRLSDYPDEVCVEDWTFARGQDTVRSLAGSQRVWFDAARRMGLRSVTLVRCAQWQGGLGFNGESAERKAASIVRAAGLLGFDVNPLVTTAVAAEVLTETRGLTENIADAVNLGSWYTRLACSGEEPGKVKKLDKLAGDPVVLWIGGAA